MARTQEQLYAGPRPRPVLVRARPARARADEARPPPPSVSRQVRPAARRGALPPPRAGARAGARPVRRLGDDARPGARERPRLGRCRHRGVQLPADGREDRRAQPVRARARSARRARAIRAGRGRRSRRDRRTCAAGSRPAARDQLLRFRSLADEYEHADVLRVVLARAARSARRTTHFDLDFPKTPAARAVLVSQASPRMPAGRARRSLPAPLHARHADAAEGVRARPSRKSCDRVCTATRASSTLPGPFDAVVTSPPYPGLIDYHEQHRYAYELLGLDDLREREIGAAARGTSKAALAAYTDGIAAVLGSVRGGAEAAWARGDRRQRPSRPVSGDPRAFGARARAALPAAREPPYRPARRASTSKTCWSPTGKRFVTIRASSTRSGRRVRIVVA